MDIDKDFAEELENATSDEEVQLILIRLLSILGMTEVSNTLAKLYDW